MKFRELMIQKRKEKGLSQRELANILGVGHSTINRIENETTENVNIKLYFDLLKFLEIDFTEIDDFNDIIPASKKNLSINKSINKNCIVCGDNLDIQELEISQNNQMIRLEMCRKHRKELAVLLCESLPKEEKKNLLLEILVNNM
ncbi:TPA: helix-turn-helix transcriptional regulator [Clostridioides difficile]|uniref:Helix-turn-helix transcriptional regulator n=1 Tax=Clostridioides difficile TaxID=1496 RepID=A0AAN5VPV5_CLODI|nr:helix-turn-helix transcriptional regulator [Clostridioides difficile]EGT3642422.1 XRE family transcriptional regulator [Clostridioides difficile]EGT3943987.1 XRE family transcriptional regulator [Clostridioides difficile]MBG0197934.1 helix-turn-helix transcriptional regulator [Clostridioides difficile]MBH7167651.1 helix-turn-helix transcriptional regulator [Clostridioides difficile]MBH7847783.1 helix-turn-helix transcriptional regulator [Clostridioides difficile]